MKLNNCKTLALGPNFDRSKMIACWNRLINMIKLKNKTLQKKFLKLML